MSEEQKQQYLDITNGHIAKVRRLSGEFMRALTQQSLEHDASKLEEPEMTGFMGFMPEWKNIQFMDESYKKALQSDTIKHHYEHNRHHPEHFENGVDGMNLVDIIEMLCDWVAAKERYSKEPFCTGDIKKQATRFKLSDQVVNILNNTYEQVLSRIE